MRLTRRDAVAVLAASGLAVGGAAVYTTQTDSGDTGSTRDEPLGTLVALAEVLYPSDVSGVAEFVETYADGRLDADGEFRQHVTDAIAVVNARARERHDAAFRHLSEDERDDVLRSLGQEYADPDPGGSERERVRYYLVNDLLYALFSSPTGGRLVGTENPAGYPGGIQAYQGAPGQ
ncbi:gluconate 2-dehydrogenase subunit 3 family protein [Halarchaeum sp. P4]|uniref:gluconate 2-dehydrogenase subunit 3 family protein n=1 Tax=Halarchaeum sp. P4 TaxID=3421639 RepID=UPI003EBC1C1D